MDLGRGWLDPVECFGELEGDLVIEAEFVETCGHCAPVPSTAEAALNLVEILSGNGIEVRSTTATASLSAAIGDLIGRFGDRIACCGSGPDQTSSTLYL